MPCLSTVPFLLVILNLRSLKPFMKEWKRISCTWGKWKYLGRSCSRVVTASPSRWPSHNLFLLFLWNFLPSIHGRHSGAPCSALNWPHKTNIMHCYSAMAFHQLYWTCIQRPFARIVKKHQLHTKSGKWKQWKIPHHVYPMLLSKVLASYSNWHSQ